MSRRSEIGSAEKGGNLEVVKNTSQGLRRGREEEDYQLQDSAAARALVPATWAANSSNTDIPTAMCHYSICYSLGNIITIT